MFGKGKGAKQKKEKKPKVTDKRLDEEFSKYPLIKRKKRNIEKLREKVEKEKRVDIFLSFTERLLMKLINIAFKFEHKIPYIRRQAIKISEDIKEDVIKAYLPFPPYSYAVLIATGLFLAEILVPVFFILLALKLVIPALIVLLFIVSNFLFAFILKIRPKSKFSISQAEMLQLLGIWYGIATSGLSPQEQFEALYNILLEYRRLNLKYGHLYPEFKLFDLFHEIHYSVKFRNYSVADALVEIIKKLEDDNLKIFFMKVLRGIKEQGDIAPIIESEYRNVVQEIQRKIESTSETVNMVTDIYIVTVSMLIGNIYVFMLIMGGMSSFTSVISSTQLGILFFSPLMVIMSLILAFLLKTLTTIKGTNVEIKYSPIHAGFSVLGIILAILLPFLTGLDNPVKLFFPAFILFAFSLPGFLAVKKVKKTIHNAEVDFPHRLHEVAVQLSFNQQLPDAIQSTVLKVKNVDMTFNDWIFYTISAYLRFGKTMKSVVEKIIIAIPSELIRIPLTVIALIEEKAGDMRGVFENFAYYTLNITEARNKVKSNITTVKMTTVVVNVMYLVLMVYLFKSVLPGVGALPLGNIQQIGNQIDLKMIGQQYIYQYSTQYPAMFKLNALLFPQTVGKNATSVGVMLGISALNSFFFIVAFALSSAIFLALLNDSPTIPEVAFYFAIFYLVMIAVGYVVVFKDVYNIQHFEKTNVIVKALQNTTKAIH